MLNPISGFVNGTELNIKLIRPDIIPSHITIEMPYGNLTYIPHFDCYEGEMIKYYKIPRNNNIIFNTVGEIKIDVQNT